mmetsp:Transcript_18589/g.62316  ORF Transcript_18589/g.62316 Transcript_18589/m.62316 type:complete len:105 (-) Transcript_18589:645-959(-)
MSQAHMYVRVKRKNQTVFVYVDPTDTVELLKAKLERVVKVPPGDMRLFSDLQAGGHALSDKDTLDKAKVVHEQELGLAFKVPGSDDFEPLDIAGPAAEERAGGE